MIVEITSSAPKRSLSQAGAHAHTAPAPAAATSPSVMPAIPLTPGGPDEPTPESAHTVAAVAPARS